MPPAQPLPRHFMPAVPSSPRVLVVDDEPALLNVTKRLLNAVDIEVVTCSNGEQALRLIEAEYFDTIISDVAMPSMSGIELLRALRKRELTVPVILITGGPSVQTAIESIEHGAFKYLLKPVGSANLVEATQRAIQLQREGQSSIIASLARGDAVSTSALHTVFDSALEALCPAFEPIGAVRDRTVFGYEGVVCSGEAALSDQAALFDAAEQLGQLADLFRQMCRRSCAVFGDSGFSRTQLFLNLHPINLDDRLLLDPSTPLFQNARHIILDVTERATFEQVLDVERRVAALREVGYRIAIDDLGAGYADLNSFAALEPEFVKLDGSMIHGLHQSSMKQRLVELMTTICHDMGTQVVAEGIQLVAERDAAIALGCDLLQGPLLGPPAHTLEAVRW